MRPATRRQALFAVLALGSRVAAQQPAVALDWVADRWDTEAGLPQNTVRSIAQTPDGYLWVATFGGLVRFDGARFRVFTAAEFPSLGTDRITALDVAADSALWIGTDEGVVRFARGRFTRWGTTNGLPAALVTAVLEDSRRTIWVSTNRGLCRLRSDRCEPFPSIGADSLGVVYGIVEDSGGTLWINARRAMGRVDTLRRRVVLGAKGAPVVGAMFAMASDSAGGLWVRTARAIVRIARGTAVEYPLPPDLIELFTGDLAPAAGGGFWIRFMGLGVVHFDPAAPPPRRFERLQPGIGERGSEWASKLFVDSEGVPWFGSEVHGLARVRPRLFRVLGKADGLADDHATAVMEARDGAILAGSACSGLSRLDTAGRRAPLPGLDFTGCVWSLLEEPDTTLWIGRWGGGVVRWRHGVAQTFGRAEGLTDPAILAIHRAADGVLWVGTQGSGVFRMRGERFENAFSTANGLPSDRVHTIVGDPDGTIWLGTPAGLARVAPNGALRVWTAADGLPRPHVRAIHRDRRGVLWIGTYGGGLARFDGRRFHAITVVNGLAENVVSAIVEDDDGGLWMSGNRGVQRVRRDELAAFTEGRASSVHATAYGINDGLIPNETNGGFQPAAWRGRDGRIWFPTILGLSVVQPARALANVVPPRVAIEEIVLDGRRREVGAGVGVAPDESPELVVAPGTRSLEINYTGLSSPAPERLEFRYRLLGLGDTAWTYAGARRTAYFSTLPPRRYRFQVSAANRDGVWSSAPAELSVRVRSTLWQSWWFRTALALGTLALAAELVRRRLAHERMERGRQRAFTQAVLTQQEAERKRVAAELHDSVGQDLLVIKNRAMMGSSGLGSLALGTRPSGLGTRHSALGGAEGPSPDSRVPSPDAPSPDDYARAQFEEISEIAGESIKEVRRIAYNLRPYQLDRIGLTAALTAAVRKAADGTEIRFDVRVDDVDAVLSPEGEIHVFRIVQEAVSNVIRHSGAASAQVAVSREAGRIRVRIEDDGRGIKSGAASSATGGGGFGLRGIAERVRVLGGTLSVVSPPDGGAVLDVSVPAAEPGGATEAAEPLRS